MAISVAIEGFTIEPDGRVRVRYDQGHEQEYGSLQAVKDAVSRLDNDTPNGLLVALGWFLARQPDGEPDNLIRGKTVTFDLSRPNPITVQ